LNSEGEEEDTGHDTDNHERDFDEGEDEITESVGIALDNEEDVCKLDLKSLDANVISQINFPNLGVAYTFYNSYAMLKGFSARKYRTRKKIGEFIQEDFVCHKEGFRTESNKNRENRQREAKAETSCGCPARFRVNFDPLT
jgi:hypothetical protein